MQRIGIFREELINLTIVIRLNVITETSYFKARLGSRAAVPEAHDWNIWQRTYYSDSSFINFTSDMWK